jgi:hypothetical protein
MEKADMFMLTTADNLHPLLSEENISMFLTAGAFIFLMALALAGLWAFDWVTERFERGASSPQKREKDTKHTKRS